jgi:NCS1 family nucleobase:cation symporter-1
LGLNWPAAIAWGASIALALGLERSGALHLFYLFLPTYLCTTAVYIVLAKMAGAGSHRGEDETLDYSDGRQSAPAPGPASPGEANTLAGVVALIALFASIGMPFGVWMEWTTLDTVRQWLILPSLVYFAAGAVFYSSWRKSTK